MSSDLWVGLTINILVPILGIALFVWLCRKMRKENVPSPPFIPWFILFSAFGGVLVMVLTALFWDWSGMASLGMLYLAGIAPFATVVMAFGLRKQCSLSLYHRRAYVAAIAYSGFVWVFVGIWLVVLYVVRPNF